MRRVSASASDRCCTRVCALVLSGRSSGLAVCHAGVRLDWAACDDVWMSVAAGFEGAPEGQESSR